jgi:hypothetical protein
MGETVISRSLVISTRPHRGRCADLGATPRWSTLPFECGGMLGRSGQVEGARFSTARSDVAEGLLALAAALPALGLATVGECLMAPA